jgi:hypothetical protein
MIDDWCAAIYRQNVDLEPCRDHLFTWLSLGYGNSLSVLPPSPTYSPDYRMIPLAFSSGNKDIICNFLCAWCSSSAPEGISDLGPYTRHIVDLVRFRPFEQRLKYFALQALCRTKHMYFKYIGQEKLIALLDEVGLDVISDVQGLRDFLLDALSSSEGRNEFPLRYWEAAAELTARDRHFHRSPDLPRMHIIRFLEAEGEWEKLTWWMGAVWASALPADVVEDQMEEIVESTELVNRHHPDAAAVIEDLVKISSEGALGVEHAKKLRGILEKRQDGTVDNGREGSSGIR